MKKLFLALIVLLILVAGALFFFGEPALEKGTQKVVQQFGPKLTGTSVQLDAVDLSIFDGRGTLTGFVVGNPEGFKTEKAMSVGVSEIDLVPKSVLGETIWIERILVDAPEIIFERNMETSNLQQIQANIEAATAGATPSEEPAESEPETAAGPSKKLAIEEFVLSNAKVTVSVLGAAKEFTLPTIRLTELGTEEGGVPPAEILGEILDVVIEEVVVLAQDFLKDPQGSIQAAQDHLDQVRQKAKENWGDAGAAVDQIRGLLGSGKKDEDSDNGGE